ncbi:MAG: glutathione synthase [Chloroflexi bacterium]|nr:glutathione synthase [Chloroflexota bacterium]
MILICGIPSEAPIAMVRQALTKLGIEYTMFNQRHFANMTLSYEIDRGQIRGELTMNGSSSNGRSHPLEQFKGVYTRLMGIEQLPELENEPPDSPLRRYAQNLHDALMTWYEIAPINVVNRTGPMGSNFSKPYQSQLIRRHGLLPPETLISNNPDAVRAFRRQHGRIIYKSISGVRSVVQTLSDEDMNRLDLIRWCPTQFQAFVPGTNVRVHTVGDKLFAASIDTTATDYRYAHTQTGTSPRLTAVDLPADIAQRCLSLTQALGLAFAGIDLKITPEGQVYCFEVNPSPAFSYYEAQTGQPIAQAVARYLAN